LKRAPSLDELLGHSDFVCVECDYNPATHKLIGARELGLMKPTAYFINTARGRIVDETALAARRSSCRNRSSVHAAILPASVGGLLAARLGLDFRGFMRQLHETGRLRRQGASADRPPSGTNAI
jgi:hypothetical protein